MGQTYQRQQPNTDIKVQTVRAVDAQKSHLQSNSIASVSEGLHLFPMKDYFMQ